MKITLQTLARFGCVTADNDLFFLPEPITPYEEDACGRWLLARRDLLAQLIPLANPDTLSPRQVFTWVIMEIVTSIGTPAFTEISRQLPDAMRRHVVYESTLSSHLPKPLETSMIVGSFPRTCSGYVTLEDGLIDHALHTFRLGRLADVKQLAFLSYPFVIDVETERIERTERFPHNRLSHVLDVAAVSSLLGMRAGLSTQEQRELRLAGLTHDALTPACGDLMKNISETAFDEDARYPELLSNPEIKAFLEKQRIRSDVLAPIIRGEGLLGTLLDMADKISYVARDAEMFVRYCQPPGYRAEEHARILDLLERSPNICAWWECVSVKRGRVYVEDPERLFKFLVLRVLLFRELYCASAARYAPMLVVRTVVEELIKTGTVSVQSLTVMTDSTLENLVKEFCGVLDLSCISDDAVPMSASFTTREEALACERELVNQGTAFSMVEDLLARIKPATEWLVQGERGRLQPFSQACPAETELLRALASVPQPYRLYWLPNVNMPRKIYDDLVAFRRKQLNLR